MDAEKWWIVLGTGVVAAFFVVVLIIIINTVGRRGQAITWLPVSLATILALQHVTEPTTLCTFLEAAYASQFISAIFIITFYFSVDSSNTLLVWSVATLSIFLPACAVWAVCYYLNSFWAFFIGTFGNIIILFFLKVAPALEFKQKSFQMSCKRFVCNLTETYLLVFSSFLTIIFITIPALLADYGYINMAGIVSNMPKVTFFVMLHLWVNKRGCCKVKKATEKIEHELKEHLTMFSYSTSITTIFLLIIWFNENEETPENFWWSWSASFFLSAIIIVGILTKLYNAKPVKRAPQKFLPSVSRLFPMNEDVGLSAKDQLRL